MHIYTYIDIDIDNLAFVLFFLTYFFLTKRKSNPAALNPAV